MAGLKLYFCIALLSPALAQVYNQQRFGSNQRQMMRGNRFGMQMGNMPGASGGTPPPLDEILDARSDMMANAMENRMMGGGDMMRSSVMPSQYNNMMGYPNAQFGAFQYPLTQQQQQQQQIQQQQLQRQQQQQQQFQYQQFNGIQQTPYTFQSPAQTYIASSNMFAPPSVVATNQIATAPGLIVDQAAYAPTVAKQVVAKPKVAAPAITVEHTPKGTVTTETSGNIPANQVIDILRDLFTGIGKKTGVKKFLLV